MVDCPSAGEFHKHYIIMLACDAVLSPRQPMSRRKVPAMAKTSVDIFCSNLAAPNLHSCRVSISCSPSQIAVLGEIGMLAAANIYEKKQVRVNCMKRCEKQGFARTKPHLDLDIVYGMPNAIMECIELAAARSARGKCSTRNFSFKGGGGGGGGSLP